MKAGQPRHAILRQSLPESLATSLRERILNGEFREGEPLIQETLAAEYQVSRMPVREALRQLEAAGLVAMRTHRGAVVTSISVEEIRELFDLRALLEGEILGHAVPKMTPADLDAARGILAALETAYRDRDSARWGALNSDFHRSLYRPAERVQSLGLIAQINVQTDRYIRMQLQLTGHFAAAEAEHRDILHLCQEGETQAAVAALRRHIDSAGDDLLAALQASRAAAG